MTVYVKDASKSVLSGLSKMKSMIEDYAEVHGSRQVGYQEEDECRLC